MPSKFNDLDENGLDQQQRDDIKDYEFIFGTDYCNNEFDDLDENGLDQQQRDDIKDYEFLFGTDNYND